MATLPPGGAQIGHQGAPRSFVEEKIKNFWKVDNEPFWWPQRPQQPPNGGRFGRHLVAR